jgi:hypothetical protein
VRIRRNRNDIPESVFILGGWEWLTICKLVKISRSICFIITVPSYIYIAYMRKYKKFWEEPIAYFLLFDNGPRRKRKKLRGHTDT